MEKELCFFLKLKTLRMTGMYEPHRVLFFTQYFQVCYVDVNLHGEVRRLKALLDDDTRNLWIKEGLVGTFEHSDLRWPATVYLDPEENVEVRWGPHDYAIDRPHLSRLSYANAAIS